MDSPVGVESYSSSWKTLRFLVNKDVEKYAWTKDIYEERIRLIKKQADERQAEALAQQARIFEMRCAAAEARAGTRAAGASLPARRATEPSPPSSLGRDDDEEDATMESMETAATSAMTSTAAAAAAAEAGAGADDPALDALADMGFARDRARAALDAAGGDIAGAVDALSHA